MLRPGILGMPKGTAVAVLRCIESAAPMPSRVDHLGPVRLWRSARDVAKSWSQYRITQHGRGVCPQMRIAGRSRCIKYGSWRTPFPSVCDLPTGALPVGRAVVPGAGHAVPVPVSLNGVLAGFRSRAEASGPEDFRDQEAGLRSAMEKLHFAARINASAHTVWTTMLDEASYRDWTSAFGPGSHYEGSWEKGARIRFLGTAEEGSPEGMLEGMLGKVVESRPDEYVCVEYLGFVGRGGVDDTTSEAAQKLAGAREAYSFSESGGVTTVEVDVDSAEEYADLFNEAWPRALARVKELAEAA